MGTVYASQMTVILVHGSYLAGVHKQISYVFGMCEALVFFPGLQLGWLVLLHWSPRGKGGGGDKV